MWYKKNLHIEEIAEEIKKKDFSKIASNAIKEIIIHHCSMHSTNFRDLQKIESKIGISSRKLLLQHQKYKKDKTKL